ncbi:MXAN_2561 family MXYO-CTERM-anchored protein [Pyxidicoccus caerfyrddinensis]|uniref:MXAN_2561 family MXYO-CTERM-anchored protein n=1 Tax=Pyxidicoccus caerfyrddinensis TaxID=2709663 RepID=UPI0013DB7DF1|nr:MXAN_2561 family MXYO-CTERM-anchored protein [Pyxidicoccus caerfyrddinensis]
MRFLFVGLLLFASTALGQTLSLTVDNITDTAKVIGLNGEDCGDKLQVRWTLTGGVACQDMLLWVTKDSSCKDAPVTATGDYELPSVAITSVNNPGNLFREIEVDKLPVFAATDGGAGTCSTAKVEQTMRVCASVKLTNVNICSDTALRVATPVLVRFDTQPPPKPTIDAVSPRDSALGVTVSAEADSTVVVTATLPDADGGTGTVVATDETTAVEGIANLEGLENGVTYQVTAKATDVAGNSTDSDPSEGTPVKSDGFYEAYIGAGGTETGGCGAAGGGLAGGAVLAALGFWLSRRKQS